MYVHYGNLAYGIDTHFQRSFMFGLVGEGVQNLSYIISHKKLVFWFSQDQREPVAYLSLHSI